MEYSVEQYLYFKSRMYGKKSISSGGDTVGTAKKCQVMTMETKVKITERVERGKKIVDIAHPYNMNCSTISIMLKNKDQIMEHVKSAMPIMLTLILKKHEKVRV